MSPLEQLRAAAVSVRLTPAVSFLYVTAHRTVGDAAADMGALATKRVPLIGRIDPGYGVVVLTYPQDTGVPDELAELAGRDHLLEAIQQVGDTGIAALVGREDFLARARRVSVSSSYRGVTLAVHRTMIDPMTQLVATDHGSGPERQFQLNGRGVGRGADRHGSYTWPLRTSCPALPDLSDDPILASALRALGGDGRA